MRHLIALLLSLSPALADTPPLALFGTTPTQIPGTDVTLQLTSIIDQRCPANTDCYWEGMMRLELAVTHMATTQTIILCNLCDDGTRQATVAGGTVTFRQLFPSTDDLALLGRAPTLSDYTVTLDITWQ